MADLSPAETMLDSLVPAQRLIRRLQGFLKAPVPYVGIHLSPDTNEKIAAFQGDLQGYIDELTARREKVLGLVKQIPDQTAQEILIMRYGLTGSGREMTWVEIEMRVPYSTHSLFRYHRKGIDQLNQLLGSAKDSERSC